MKTDNGHYRLCAYIMYLFKYVSKNTLFYLKMHTISSITRLCFCAKC